LRIMAVSLAAPLALAASFILPLDRTVLFLLLPYFVVSALQNLLFAFFRGIEDMRREALILPLEKCAALILLPLLSLLGITHASLGATALLCSVLIGASVLLATSTPNLQRAFVKGAATGTLPYRDLLKEGVALGAVTFLWLIYFRGGGDLQRRVQDFGGTPLRASHHHDRIFPDTRKAREIR